MRKIVNTIIIGLLSVAAVLTGLWFMGVISFAGQDTSGDDETIREEPWRDVRDEVWEIKYNGMKFFVDAKATAYIYESGCLNISLTDDYLIQLNPEEETIDTFWENRERKMESLIESGYRIETEPERLTMEEREYIRYVVSLDKSNSDYDRMFFQVLLTPDNKGGRFLICVRYDGIDVEKLDEASRVQLHVSSMDMVEQLMDSAVPTDEEDDEIGSLWMPDISSDSEKVYLIQDSQEYAGGTVTYHLPKDCYVLSEGIVGRNYKIENEDICINVSVREKSMSNAEERAENHTAAGFSKVHTQGEIEIDGRTFYYYTYSVKQCSKEDESYNYHFYAFCDLKNGDVYEVSGWSYVNDEAMDCDFYLDVMKFSE